MVKPPYHSQNQAQLAVLGEIGNSLLDSEDFEGGGMRDRESGGKAEENVVGIWLG